MTHQTVPASTDIVGYRDVFYNQLIIDETIRLKNPNYVCFKISYGSCKTKSALEYTLPILPT